MSRCTRGRHRFRSAGERRGTRSAFGLRLETFVCARAAGDAWPPALRLRRARACSVSLSWASISFEDRDLIVPKSVRSTNFRAGGCAPFRALRREACGAARAPEFVGSVALLRSRAGRLCSFPRAWREACGAWRAPAERRGALRRGAGGAARLSLWAVSFYCATSTSARTDRTSGAHHSPFAPSRHTTARANSSSWPCPAPVATSASLAKPPPGAPAVPS